MLSTAHNVFPNLHKLGFWSSNTICVSTQVEEYINKVSKSETIVVYNSILEVSSTISKERMRKKLEIYNKIILINVGRLTNQKSQKNIVEIARKIEEEKSNLINEYVFLIIGTCYFGLLVHMNCIKYKINL